MVKKFDFTRAYAELEEIVSDFEAREIDLEKDMPKFKHGLELAEKLKKRLSKLENIVTDVEKEIVNDTQDETE